MTIGNLAPAKESKFRKTEKAVDITAPLLPAKHDAGASMDAFEGASFSGAVFNLSTTIVGAGIMALPATMKVLGLGLGITMIVFMAFLTERSIDMLLKFSRAGKSVSYGDAMGYSFGSTGRILLQICVLINNIGVLIVYMIIIGDVVSGTSSNGIHHAGILEAWFGEHWWTGRFVVLFFNTLAVFAPLGCFKRFDSLRFTSSSYNEIAGPILRIGRNFVDSVSAATRNKRNATEEEIHCGFAEISTKYRMSANVADIFRNIGHHTKID